VDRRDPAHLRRLTPIRGGHCVGSALGREDLQRLLASSGFRLLAVRSCTEEAAEMAERVHDRLRGARILGADRIVVSALAIEEAIAMAAAAREAIANGSLDYAIFAAAC
jgi:hypothetical protein